MKKRIVSAFLALTLALYLTGTAFAAVTEITVTTIQPAGKTVTATLSADKKYIDLTVTGLTSGGQYMVFMVSGTHTDPNAAQITETTLKYIDQAQADGSVTFKVYPSSMQNSTILISGTDMELTIVATVEVPYRLGDINNDGSRNGKDLTRLAKHIARIEFLTDNFKLAADINQDGSVNGKDLTRLAKHIAKIELIP